MKRLIPIAAALVAMALGPGPGSAQKGVGFRFTFGDQTMGGDMGRVLDGAVDAEFSFLVPAGPVRVGAGTNWASFKQDATEASWSQIRFHVLAGIARPLTAVLRPYLEARYTFRRLRPEDDRYFGGGDELLRDFEVSGSGAEGVVGVEFVLNHGLAIDLAGAYGVFKVSPDLSDEVLGSADSGSTLRVHLGVSWFPFNGRS